MMNQLIKLNMIILSSIRYNIRINKIIILELNTIIKIQKTIISLGLIHKMKY